MSWTYEPGPRADLIVEGQFGTDGSGFYVGDWIDTTDIHTVRFSVATQTNDGDFFQIEEGYVIAGEDNSGGPFSIGIQTFDLASGKATGTFDLTGRWFRIRFHGVTADANAYAVLRVVS